MKTKDLTKNLLHNKCAELCIPNRYNIFNNINYIKMLSIEKKIIS
jgi:hypothetical protein